MSLQPTRPLPAHEGAERLVLGALLLSSAAIDDVMPVLRPDDFSDIGHASIWAAMQEIHAKRHPVDLMTVAEKMRQLGSMPRLRTETQNARRYDRRALGKTGTATSIMPRRLQAVIGNAPRSRQRSRCGFLFDKTFSL